MSFPPKENKITCKVTQWLWRVSNCPATKKLMFPSQMARMDPLLALSGAIPPNHKYSYLRKGEMQQGLTKWSLPNCQAPKGWRKWFLKLCSLTWMSEVAAGRVFVICLATEEKLWLLPVKEQSAEAKHDVSCPLQTLCAPSCSFCFRHPTVSRVEIINKKKR